MKLERRLFLACLAVAVLAAGCSGGGSPPQPSPPPPGSIKALEQGATQLSLLGTAGQAPQDAIQTGKSELTFGLSSQQGYLVGGAPQVYLGKSDTSKALGPFRATWQAFTGYKVTHDHSPKTQLPGFYSAPVDVPSAGIWTIAAVAQNGSSKGIGLAHAYFLDNVPNGVGSKATSVKTPVASGAKTARICTRQPPDDMHYISLDQALRNGKPTVVSFATPLLCESQLCGPVVDEQLLVFQKYGKVKANFIHVEEFLPGKDLQPPAAQAQNTSPGFKAWHLLSEPWVFVIDRHGVIRARFGPGAVSAAEIESALRPLL